MCLFSQPVERVSDTNIFAREVNGRQVLVYSMTYAAAGDLAMVLPLPVPPHPPEDAVRFINLERYPTFFGDMHEGLWPTMRYAALGVESQMLGLPTLKVHEVGSFEASFVPCREDFARLDERFRIPGDAWDQLPAYRDYGFAVFKLKGTVARRSGIAASADAAGPEPWDELEPRWLGSESRGVHPMAFEFPRRDPDLLYFPTVHIHDRTVHPNARFDHTLYCQATEEAYLDGWEKSDQRASVFMDLSRAEGLVDPAEHLWGRRLRGRLENKDTLVGRGGSIPELVDARW